MFYSIASILIGLFFCFYDFFLILLNPGTILNIIFSFTHIWTVLGAILIFLGIYKIKTKKTFWSVLNKKIQIILTVCFLIGLFICSVTLFFICTPKLASIQEECDYLILLGGGIDKNGNISQTALKRIQKAVEYLNIHKNTICVISGGTLRWLPYAEAPKMKKQLIKMGINENRILVEDQAQDTIQNLAFSCNLLAESQGKTKKQILKSKITIITTHYHLHRAELLASRIGFSNFNGIASDVSIFEAPNSYLREICAYIKLNLRILLTDEPRLIDENS